MKELTKPAKKREVFELLKVTAFHEERGYYLKFDYYHQGPGADYYDRGGALPSQEDVLF